MTDALESMQKEFLRIQQLLLTLIEAKNFSPIQEKSKIIYQAKIAELEAGLAAIKNNTKQEFAEFFPLLDDLLQSEKWIGSPLLQAAGQQLKKTYNYLRAIEQEQSALEIAKKNQEAELAAKRSNMSQVFISLYQADGFNMQKWAALLNSIQESSLSSRAVYRLEEDACAVVRMKEQKQNEGYAAIYISPNAILPAALGQPAVDKQGHELVFIKAGSLKTENVIYFCHISGRYILKDNILVRQGDGLII